ncbi:MAG: hypothetical protein ABI564_18180 [Ideonella sp.]
MSLKKFDLAKNLAKKLEGQRKGAQIPGRFGESSAEIPDRREQRRRDTAAGLIPFACKLPAELADRLRERSLTHPAGLNALIEEMLSHELERLERLPI